MSVREIVTGLAGAGKTTLALDLVKKYRDDGLHVTLISADEFRYEPAGTWRKAPLSLFRERIEREIEASGGNFVFESSYLDVSDPEDARGVIIRELLPTATALFVLTDTLQTIQENILQRSLDRAAGKIPPGAAPETSQSVLKLLDKVRTGYDAVTAALKALSASFSGPHLYFGPCQYAIKFKAVIS